MSKSYKIIVEITRIFNNFEIFMKPFNDVVVIYSKSKIFRHNIMMPP